MKITRLLAPILAFVFVLSMPISATATEVKVIALFANKAMLKVGDQQGVVKVGETFGGVLLKSATGRGAVVEIDGEEVKLGLNQSIAGNYKKPERQKLKIYPTKSGMYFVDGEINGAATRFLVDTGATFVTLSGDKARELDIDFLKGKQSFAKTAAAVVPTWQVKLKSVDIGGILLRNVDATVLEGNQPFEVLLGNSYLRHMRLLQAGSALEIMRLY